MSPDDRKARGRRAWALGLRAESLAVWMLRFKGYRILARRAKTPVGELDIVARRGRLLVIVEVKARGSLRDAAESLTVHQRQRIERAAEAYVARHPDLALLDMRFDVILVPPGRWPHHLMDAWRPGL
ncbi:YraN family protein [Magnetospira thiophila]